jgi:hypothetical protein
LAATVPISCASSPGRGYVGYMQLTSSGAPSTATSQLDAVRYETRRHEQKNGYGIWDLALGKWASAPTFESDKVSAAVAEAMNSRALGKTR